MATERIFVNPLHTRHLRDRRPSEVIRRRVHTPTENSPYGGVQAWGGWFFVRRCEPAAANRRCGWTTCRPEELPRLAEQDRVDFVFPHGSGFSGTVTETFFDRSGHFQLARVALDEPIVGVDTMTCFSGDPTVKRVETEQDVLYRLLCRSVPLAQRAITCPPPVSREQERERVIAALMQIDRMSRLLTSWSQGLAARIGLPNPPNPGREGPGRATTLCLERRAWWKLFASCWISHCQGLVDDPHLLAALFALAQASDCHPDISEENGAPFLSICPLDSSAGREACTCTLWNAHWGALYRAGAAYADTRPEEEVDDLEETLDLLFDYDWANPREGGRL